tara:strand:+ start:466 stop:1443 length:978 start_codon:yes stop_codon:yes gene_type:complete
MILKYYEIDKINPIINNFYLFYGQNNGLKKQTIEKLISSKKNVYSYDEIELFKNKEEFIDSLFSKSLFEEEKTIIVNRITDKIIKIIEEINYKNISDINIIFNAHNLEKKSKLRSFFEKSKKYVCIAFYPDSEQSLYKMASDYLRKENILISNQNLNLIVSKCNGDRENLLNEIEKIILFCKNGKKLTTENVNKLTNLAENHNVSELIDHCLAKNKNKIIKILNENNFNNDDCMLITRTFLNKSKRILYLSNEYKKNQDMELTISSAKPPIFWKDKEVTKKQVYERSPENIKKLIYELSNIELQLKKNINLSIIILNNFILEQAS